MPIIYTLVTTSIDAQGKPYIRTDEAHPSETLQGALKEAMPFYRCVGGSDKIVGIMALDLETGLFKQWLLQYEVEAVLSDLKRWEDAA